MRQLKQECRNLDGRALAVACVRIAEEAKAEDLVVLDVRGLASFTDYFLIMSSRSTRHVDLIQCIKSLWLPLQSLQCDYRM